MASYCSDGGEVELTKAILFVLQTGSAHTGSPHFIMSDSANIRPMVMSLRINKRHFLTAELAISAQVHLDYEQTVIACAKRVFLSALC